jgi:class 3 adenylate cyclase/DNA-binding transcriptional MerR regulator
MLTSRTLLEATGISRATLNNYIAMGLLPKPQVKRMSPAPGEPAATLGYFPDWALDRIEQIQHLKKSGQALEDIRHALGVHVDSSTHRTGNFPAVQTEDSASAQNTDVPPQPRVDAGEDRATTSHTAAAWQRESVQVSIDHIPYAAYMVNYEFQLVWINRQAQSEFFGTAPIPERAQDRSMVRTLLEWSATLPFHAQQALLQAHIGLIKHRMPRQAFASQTSALPEKKRQWLLDCFDHCPQVSSRWTQTTRIQHPAPENGSCHLVTLSFREGILVIFVPEQASVDELVGWLAQRDSVIRTLLGQRLPVLTPLAVLVGELQNSVRICSELPPEEYFELINQIWSSLDPIFRKYYGAYGKHTGDGMVYYFFPQPDSNYLLSAVQCALKIRETMRRISQEWQIRKGWANQLYMNIGLNEGEEWLGTFKTHTSCELVVLGETITTCARLSDFARFGKVWATKNLISKLSANALESVRYGVEQTSDEGQVFVKNTYVQLSSQLNLNEPKHAKLAEIARLAVAEVQAI